MMWLKIPTSFTWFVVFWELKMFSFGPQIVYQERPLIGILQLASRFDLRWYGDA